MTDLLPPPPAAPTPSPTRPIYRRPWFLVTTGIVVVFIVISIAASSGGSKKTVDEKGPTIVSAPATSEATSESPNAVTPAPPATKVDKTKAEAVKIIAQAKPYADQVRAIVGLVTITIAQSATDGDIYTVASYAQQAHDALDDLKYSIRLSGHFSDQTVAMNSAINDLKNSMGDLLAYTGNPNPATLAKATNGYANAAQEWNTAVDVIWSAAGQPAPDVPPTL